MKQTISFARKLNQDDTGFYFLGKQERCNVAMVMLGILARPVDIAEALATLSAAADAIPRFKDYLRPTPFDIGPPSWRPTNGFDIGQHVSEMTLDAGASWTDALGVMDRLQAMPFSARRPPWEITLIRNVPGGKAAMLMRVHHALSDGTALALMFGKAFAPAFMESAGVEVEVVCERAPAKMAIAIELRDYGRALAAWLSCVSTVCPQLLRAEVIRRREIASLRRIAKPVRRWPAAAYGMQRRLSGFRVLAEHWREEARLRGGGSNDLYLAAVANAMRRYWTSLDLDTRPLQVVMPVNTRDAEQVQDGGNVTAVGVVELTGAEKDLERLANVRRKAMEVKRNAAQDERGLVAATVAVLPRAARGPLQFREFATRDIVASNVPMPIRGELCGVPFEMMFMVAPAIGTAVSFTLTSYGEHFYLASNADVGVIQDPERLERCIASTLFHLFDERIEVLRDGTMTGAVT